MYGPFRIFWANLTPFSLKWRYVTAGAARALRTATTFVCADASALCSQPDDYYEAATGEGAAGSAADEAAGQEDDARAPEEPPAKRPRGHTTSVAREEVDPSGELWQAHLGQEERRGAEEEDEEEDEEEEEEEEEEEGEEGEEDEDEDEDEEDEDKEHEGDEEQRANALREDFRAAPARKRRSRTHWTPGEDAVLRQQAESHGLAKGTPWLNSQFESIARGIPGKGGEQCRERWLLQLGPPPREEPIEGKIHRVDPDFGSTSTVSNRDSQSNCWVNLKIMGLPCEFQVRSGRASTR
jgi:hypothetical protein